MREYTKKRRTSSEYRGNDCKRHEKRKESVEKLINSEKERKSHPNEINVNNREFLFRGIFGS